ncbi:MAG: FAD-binding oxidoreductase, partial [Candidatus Magasanikbacteria bacterium]|nr:FAD-binding oxidoreductase [Candidatus Magasanikbacteria bacterium]
KFLPEVFMTLTHGVPKLLIIAEFTGDSEVELSDTAIKAQTAIQKQYGLKTHITKNTAESEKYWTFRHESFNLLREKVKNLHTAPFIDDFIVHPSDLPDFLPRLNLIFSRYPSLVYTIAGHAGDANFHIIPLMDLSKEKERAIIPTLSQEVYDLVLEYHGSITAEHNDGLVRGPYLEQMYGSKIFELFKQVKEIFDPLNIFNPHKKTDATKQYLTDHIQKEV